MFGLTSFETLMAVWALLALVIRAGEWIFRRTLDSTEFVKKDDWEKARVEDKEYGRHFTRGEIGLYMRKDMYDRDWKDMNRRVEHLEGRRA